MVGFICQMWQCMPVDCRINAEITWGFVLRTMNIWRKIINMWCVSGLCRIHYSSHIPILSCCGGCWQLKPPPLISLTLWAPAWGRPWERCTFPGRHSYVQIERRDGTWAGSHQRNNMCARHSAGWRALWSKPQKARNYRCLSFSITESLNTSGGIVEPSHPLLQLGGNSCFLTIYS